MSRHPAGSLMFFLAEVPDPRGRPGKRRPPVAMLTQACCAMLWDALGSAAIAPWGRDQPIEFMRPVALSPLEGAFGFLVSRLDAEALETALARWAAHLFSWASRPSLNGMPSPWMAKRHAAV